MQLFHCRRRRAAPIVAALALAVGLVLVTAPAAAQTGTIEGRVTAAASGDPVEGARVAIVGTNIGTRTGADGRFVLLNVPAGTSRLQVLLIGYAMGTVRFNVRPGVITTVNIELRTSVLRLDEIVVTGTAGQARRREVGNSIVQLSVAEMADPPASVDQMLQGRAAGVSVMQTGGMSGAGAQIRLRGAVSVSQSNQPLLYIDGVRVRSGGYRTNRPPVGFRGRSGNYEASPLNDINPADIERIEIIKGAAASTLYGTEAAAGVIQIFTKKGRSGKPRWTLQLDQGFARVLPFGTDENPYLNLKPCTEGTSCWDEWTTSEVKGNCGDDVLILDKNCSWLRNGRRQKFSASVGGGSDRFQYFVSGALNDNDGVLPNDNEKTLTTRGNFSYEVLDNLRIDVTTSYTNNRIENTAAGNNAHGVSLSVFRAERNYFGDSDPNNLRQLLNQEITTQIDHLITGATVNYSPTPWFTNRFTLGWDLAQQENRNLRPFGFVRAKDGILSDEQIKYSTLTSDYAGSVNFHLSDDLATTFSFGGQAITEDYIRTMAYGEDFPGPGIPTVSSAAAFIARESRIRTVNAGFFFQNLFALKDRYFFTAGVRFDGHSAFGSNLGLEAYPKGQLSYVISDEDFFPVSMGEMKLRAALGWSGRAPDAFDAVRTWNPIAVDFKPGFRPDNVGNPDVGPERTREIEFGVDWAFLDQRLSAEFTWYEQKTTNALFDVSQIPSNGFLGSQIANVGAIRNRGIELSVNADVFDQPDFGLELGSTFYTNHSLVLDLGGAAPFEAGTETDFWVEEGFPVMAMTGIQIRNKDEIAEPDTACTVSCNANGLYVFGPSQPTFIWNQMLTLRLPGGVRLSARGEFQAGAYIYDGASGNGLSRSVLWPTCANAHGILGSPQDMTKYDQLTAWERHACVPKNHDYDIHVYKQDFWKLRDLTARIPLDWAFPQVQSAWLTLTAQNWVRWINSDLRMFDPEMTSRYSISESNRTISEHVPPPAIFTASLRVTF